MSLQENPHLVIDSNNEAAYIVIVTATGLSWTLLTLIIRLVSKLHVKRALGLEEVLVITASVTAAISSACVLGSIQHGLGARGSNFSNEDIDIVMKLIWVSDIFYLITLAIAKGAALPLLTQLTRIKNFILACHSLAVFIVIWGVLSTCIIAARCHLESPWLDDSASKCPSLYPRWVAIETFSILIEICIFGIFVSIIHILKMRQVVKLNVILAFSTRLPVIIPTVFRLIYLRCGLNVDQDPQFSLTNAIIATQVILHYTTMAASFAYLKPFLRAFDSNLGGTVKVDTVVSTGYAHEDWSEHGTSRRRSISRSEDIGHRRIASYRMKRLQYRHTAESEVTENHHPYPVPQPPQMRSSPSAKDRLDHTPLLSSMVFDRERTQSKKQPSRESITPMITKTQEWHIETEERKNEDLNKKSLKMPPTITYVPAS